jgi:excisionase family DNA binding protein
MDKLLFTPKEVAGILGVGRTKVFELLKRGELASLRIDGCRRISATALREYVDSLADRSAA